MFVLISSKDNSSASSKIFEYIYYLLQNEQSISILLGWQLQIPSEHMSFLE